MQAVVKSESMLLFGRRSTIQATAGASRWGGFGAINLPVTLAVPARMLTARPTAGGYEIKANISATSCDDWAYCQQHRDEAVALTLPKAPGPDELIPLTVTLNLNTLGQRLSFVVLDDAGAGVGRSELDYKYKPRSQKTSEKAR
jgi:hypothetical protein